MTRHLRWDSTGIVAMTPIQFASDDHKSCFLLAPGRRWSIHIAEPKTDLPCLTQAFQLGLPSGPDPARFPIDDSPESA